MKFCLSGLMLVIMLTGCASQYGQQTADHADPLEPYNRVVFDFNYLVLDHYVVRPAAVAWRDYLPESARNGLRNFTRNLEEPAVMVNYFLQGNPYDGMVHLTRFFLNSTLGMAGFIDVAEMSNPKLHSVRTRRFGTTLAYYGVGYGPYLQVPFYGSFTLRDDGGTLVDHLYPPLSWLGWPLAIGRWLVQGVENRAQLLSSDGLLRQSDDPYIFTRDAYFQYHDFIANGGNYTPPQNPNEQLIKDNLNEIDAP